MLSTVQSFARCRKNFVALALFLCVAMLFCFSSMNAAAKKQLPAHPFDLNTATLKQLEELPGVGPVTAHAILNFREKSGPFKSVNDLLVIPRISKKKLDKIRPYVFVKPPAKSAAPTAKPPAKAAAPAKPHPEKTNRCANFTIPAERCAFNSDASRSLKMLPIKRSDAKFSPD